MKIIEERQKNAVIRRITVLDMEPRKDAMGGRKHHPRRQERPPVPPITPDDDGAGHWDY